MGKMHHQSSNPYSNLSNQVNSAISELEASDFHYEPQNAHELYKLENSVQIFFVTASGHVSTFSSPETLRIFKFQQQDDAETTGYFLQVGGWTHPLIAGASPCLVAENGAIMFPDIYSDNPDTSVGLVLVDTVADQQLGRLGSSIVKGCEMLAQGIEVGAEKAGNLIEYYTEKSQEKMTKAEEDAKMGSLAKGSVNVAKSASTATVKVSGFVADRVGKLTKSLANYLAAKATPSTSLANTNKKPGAMAYLGGCRQRRSHRLW